MWKESEPSSPIKILKCLSTQSGILDDKIISLSTLSVAKGLIMIMGVTRSSVFVFYTGLSSKKKKKQIKPDIVIHAYDMVFTSRIIDET